METGAGEVLENRCSNVVAVRVGCVVKDWEESALLDVASNDELQAGSAILALGRKFRKDSLSLVLLVLDQTRYGGRCMRDGRSLRSRIPPP